VGTEHRGAVEEPLGTDGSGRKQLDSPPPPTYAAASREEPTRPKRRWYARLSIQLVGSVGSTEARLPSTFAASAVSLEMAKTTYRQRRLKRRMYSARRRKKSRIKSRARSRRSRAVTSSLANQVFNKRKPRLPGIGKCRVQGGSVRGRDNARPYRARRGRGRGRGKVRSPSSSSSGPSKPTPEAFQWFVGILIYGTIALMCMAGSLPAAPLVIWYCVSSGLGMLWNGACKLWDHRTEIRDDIFHHIVQEYFDFVYNDERHLAPNALGPGFGGIRTFLRLVCRYNGPHFVVNPCGRVRPNEQEMDGGCCDESTTRIS